MPKAVKLTKGKEFSFARSAQASKYPWDEWFNPDQKHFPGGLIMLERSVVEKGANGEDAKNAEGDLIVLEKRDFDVEVDAMPGKIKAAARRRYKVVAISKKDADGNKLQDAIVIKARDMTADERLEEDRLRAEEKANRKAKVEEEGDDETPSTDEAQ